MPRPAYFVEGLMEQKIVQKLCPDAPVRQIGCNGRDAPMAVVASFIARQAQTLGNRHYPIVIIFDREQRTADCSTLIDELLCRLEEKGLRRDQFRVGMPDRCIENWILADHESWLESPGKVRQKYRDGEMGKSRLQRLLTQDSFYHEATVGVKLFLKCRAEIIYQNSPSFRAFVDALDIACPWAARARSA